jgi:hypothetical protein
MNKLSIEKRAQIIGMLVEGNSMRAVCGSCVDVGGDCSATLNFAMSYFKVEKREITTAVLFLLRSNLTAS